MEEIFERLPGGLIDVATQSIFIDESGFTGFDLLNRDQPHFCVASTLIGDEEAEKILAESFPDYAGAEYKFSNIWKRQRNRAGLALLAAKIPKLLDRIFIYWIDKKFCVLTKLVDSLVEPIAHAAGYDFYANGYAPRYCNMWHVGLQLFGEPELYDVTLEIYQRFTREPTLQSLADLQWRFNIMAASVHENLRDFYQMAALGAEQFLHFHDLEEHRKSSELQLTTVLEIVAHWRNLLDDDLAVYHDASSNFFRNTDMWERITNPDVPEQVHPGANGAVHRFPLRVVSTEAWQSAQHPAIQLCDVLAGFAAKVAAKAPEDLPILSELLAAGFGELGMNGIRPEEQMPSGPPMLLNGPDAVDLLKAIMFPDGQQS